MGFQCWVSKDLKFADLNLLILFIKELYFSHQFACTGCPVDLSSTLISIYIFSDFPIKKDVLLLHEGGGRGQLVNPGPTALYKERAKVASMFCHSLLHVESRIIFPLSKVFSKKLATHDWNGWLLHEEFPSPSLSLPSLSLGPFWPEWLARI